MNVVALTIGVTWLAAFFGPVILIYEARGGNTLTDAQGAACLLLSLPPTIAVTVLLAIATSLSDRLETV